MATFGPEQQIGITARAMLDGTLNYLVGALKLTDLRLEIGAYENDPDFFAFVGIKSQLLDQPFDVDEADWLDIARAQYPEELQESEEFARQFSLVQCQSLAERY